MSPSTTAITASLPVEKQGVVSALNDTAREMGAALGIALFGSILNAQYRANISDAAAALPPELAEPVRAGIGGALAVAGQLGPEGSALLEASRNAWIEGMRPTMWLAAAIALTTAGYTAWSAIHAAPGPEAATGPTSRSPSSDARPG
jgi:hypothetical protein